MLAGHLPEPADRPGLLLHIGAGRGAWLGDILDAGFAAIELVEANPDRLAGLARLAETHPQVALRHAAVTAEPSGAGVGAADKAVLHVLNAEDLSTLADPAPLRRLLPGLRVLAEPEVPAIGITALCAALPLLSEDRPHWLVLEAPGCEYALLSALAQDGALGRFDRVAVRVGAEDHFGTGSARGPLRARLAEAGFVADQVRGDEDPDWPLCLFRRDIAALEVRRLDGELAEVRTALETERAAHAEVRTALEAERAAHAEARAALETAVQDATRAAEAEQRLRDELAIALRLQTMAREDQKELQTRYAELKKQKARQEQLILKLTDRLSNAAGYLRQISEDDGGGTPLVPDHGAPGDGPPEP